MTMLSTSSSGWNWVACTWRPIRKACTGQVADDARRTAPVGSLVTASLWPRNASKTGGSTPSSGSAAPSSVTVIVTAPIGSDQVRSTRPPARVPRVPTP